MSSPYISNTDEDRVAMLASIGVASVEELFEDIPLAYRNPTLHLPEALPELELKRELGRMAGNNLPLESYPSFLGGGSFRHFIPSVVGHILSRSEFYTSYTPYQPEISQGSLQAMFEYQSMICQLTGMEAANSGMYDGATALAEAALMAVRVTGRRKVAVLSTVNPQARRVLTTYASGPELEIETLDPRPGPLDNSYACLIIQSPNFFGYLEDLKEWEPWVHNAGALLVVSVDPISLGMLKPPGDYNADIVVGEGQPLGTPMTYGGPGLGIFACKDAYLRQMPGRIIGRAVDNRERVGYVMTLQTREQHIRRERATSNICTSQNLIALAAAVYLATMGPQGLRQVAELCYHKAHYTAEQLDALPGYSLPIKGTFFKEFVVSCPVPPAQVNRRLLEAGIMGGLDVSDYVERGLLLCVTEMNTRDEIDRLVVEMAKIGGGR